MRDEEREKEGRKGEIKVWYRNSFESFVKDLCDLCIKKAKEGETKDTINPV